MAIDGSELLTHYFLPSASSPTVDDIVGLMGFPREPRNGEHEHVFEFLDRIGFDFFETNCHGIGSTLRV